MTDDVDTLSLTAEIVCAYLGASTHVKADDIPQIIKSVRQALVEKEPPVEATASDGETDKPTKAQIRKSVTPDALISFVDGKPYKTLKRHLARHGMDMASYKDRYGLPSDYPSVAANYSASRSEMSKALGLGVRGRRTGSSAEPAAAPPEHGPLPAAAAESADPPKSPGRRKKATV